MKNLYRFLAFLMFACFITITGSLVLNKAIDEAVVSADSKFETLTKQYSEKLTDAKVKHNLYFVNCFPNVCAKISFARYEKTSTVVNAELDENGQVKDEVETTKTDRYDVGFTDFIIAKYSPLTGKMTLDLNANNVILLKNNEKLGSAYFQKLKYDASFDPAAKEESLKADTTIEIEEPRVSYEDLRFKATDLAFHARSYDVKEETVSSDVDFVLEGLSINNDPKKLDMVYNLTLENFDKQAVLDGMKFSDGKFAALATDNEDVKEAFAKDLLKYAESLMLAVKKFDANKTVIRIQDAKIKEYDEAEEGKLLADVNFNAELTLDANLDPLGTLVIESIAVDEVDAEAMEAAMVTDPTTGKAYKIFAKQENGLYVANVKFENGLAVLNGEEINIKGKLGNLLNFASTMIGLMAMQSGM